MITRQFRNQDAEKVSKIIIKCLKEVNSQYYPEKVIKKMISQNKPSDIIKTSKKRLILVSEDINEDIVGTGTFNNEFFGSVYVDPNYKRRGIGKKIVKSLEKLAKFNGATQVRLKVSINAVKFYEKQGYTKKDKVSDEKFGESYEMIKKFE